MSLSNWTLCEKIESWLRTNHQPQSYLEGSNSFVFEDAVSEPLPLVSEATPSEQDFRPEAVLPININKG